MNQPNSTPLSPAEVIAQLRTLAESPDFVSGVLFSAPKGARTNEAERVVRLLQRAAQIIAEPQRFRLLTADERYAIKRLLELLPADELVTTLQVRIDDVAVLDCHVGQIVIEALERVEAKQKQAADLLAASGQPTTDFKALASAMRKVLPPKLLDEVIAHLDPLTPFLAVLREVDPHRLVVGLKKCDGQHTIATPCFDPNCSQKGHSA